MPNFNDDAVARIQNVVKRVERMPINLPHVRPAPTPWGSKGFLAVLTSTYSSGYSWSVVNLDEDGLKTTADADGSSTECGKAYHFYDSQTIPNGEYVWMLSTRRFILMNPSPRRVMTTSAVTAGADNNSSFGTGTCSYGEVRNYFNTTFTSGSFIYITLNGGSWEIIAGSCPA